MDGNNYNYRCINIVIVNKENQILVQKRSQIQKHQPLHWDISMWTHTQEDYPDGEDKLH